MFDALDAFGQSRGDDALETYLSTGLEADVNLIQHWKARLDPLEAKVSPRGALARMGLDYATAPGLLFSFKVSHIANNLLHSY